MGNRIGAFALAALLTMSTLAVAGPRVAEDSRVTTALRAMTENVIARWEILLVRPGGDALIGSPPRPYSAIPGFCTREVLLLGVDSKGQLLSVDEQVERMNINGISPAFTMFALQDNGSCTVPSN